MIARNNDNEVTPTSPGDSVPRGIGAQILPHPDLGKNYFFIGGSQGPKNNFKLKRKCLSTMEKYRKLQENFSIGVLNKIIFTVIQQIRFSVNIEEKILKCTNAQNTFWLFVHLPSTILISHIVLPQWIRVEILDSDETEQRILNYHSYRHFLLVSNSYLRFRP